MRHISKAAARLARALFLCGVPTHLSTGEFDGRITSHTNSPACGEMTYSGGGFGIAESARSMVVKLLMTAEAELNETLAPVFASIITGQLLLSKSISSSILGRIRLRISLKHQFNIIFA